MQQRQPDFASRICFSDEAVFTQAGPVNKQNTRNWSVENPQWVIQVEVQQRWKIVYIHSRSLSQRIQNNLTNFKNKHNLRDLSHLVKINILNH